MWGKDFSQNGAQLFDDVNAKEMVDTLSNVFQANTKEIDSRLQSFLTKSSTPEVVVFFLRDVENMGEYSRILNMYNEHAKSEFSNLRKNIISGAHGGSVVMPYCSVENLVVSVVNPLSQVLEENAKRIVLNGKRDELFLNQNFVELKDLDESDIFTNKKTDFVVVKLREEEDVMEKIDNVVFEKTSGNYLGVLSFEVNNNNNNNNNNVKNTVKRTTKQEQEEVVIVHHFAARAEGDNTTSTRPGTYFPSQVWGWLLVSLVLLYFFLSSILSLKDVQVPPKLLSVDQVKHKKLH